MKLTFHLHDTALNLKDSFSHTYKDDQEITVGTDRLRGALLYEQLAFR